MNRHVVHIVRADVGGCFEVGGQSERQRAGRTVDGELRRVRSAGDRVGQRVARQVRIRRRDRRDRRRVLGHVDRCRGPATIAGNRWRVVIEGRDRHRDRLCIGQRAVGDLHRHVVDVVGPDIRGCLEVWSHGKCQRAGRTVDGELRRVRSARDRVGQRLGRQVRIRRRDRRDRCGVLGDVDRGRCSPAV